jgi:hypothetical protein
MTSTLRTLAMATAAGVVIALTVSGMAQAITSNVFRYSPERTGSYTISPAAFAPASSTTANNYLINAFAIRADAGGCFNTGVNLPHGAKPKALAMWYSSDSNAGVSASLQVSALTSGAVGFLGQATSSDTTQTRQVASVNLTGVLAINNNQNAYLVIVCLNGLNDRYLGGRITYTYATAGD